MRKRTFADQKGLTLVEILVAVTLIAVSSPLLYRAFYQGTKVCKKLDFTFQSEKRSFRVFSHIRQDLNNAILFSEVPFSGKEDGFMFASLGDHINRVRYELKNGEIVRNNQMVTKNGTEDLAGKDVDETLLADKVRSFSVSYAYRQSDGRIIYLSNWRAHSDIPKAVKMTLLFEGKKESPEDLFMILPQGIVKTLES